MPPSTIVEHAASHCVGRLTNDISRLQARRERLSYNAISFAGIAPNDAKLFDRRAAPAQAEAAMRSWGHVHAA